MTTQTGRESAKIYAFPLRGRPGVRRDEFRPAETRTQPVFADVSGSGWYHEAALRDADRSRKP